MNVENKLAKIDLNLIVSLSVLLQERNVSRAAERLYLSQSAMSRTLQRLRDAFEDPLFHRTAKGIMPTVKALELEKKLPNLLIELDTFIQLNTFDPKTDTSSLSISVPAMMSHVLMFPFIRKLNEQAPNIKISEYGAHIDPFKQLSDGNIDFALHIDKPVNDDFNATLIAKLVPTIYAQKNHPIFEHQDDILQQCSNYAFAELIHQTNDNTNFQHPIDKLLSEHGIEKKVSLRSAQLSTIIEMLTSQNLLLIAPDLLNESNQLSDQIAPVYQFDANPKDIFDLYLLSHKRINNSPVHQWVETLFLSTI